MTQHESTRLAVVENQITNIQQGVNEIKEMLKLHSEQQEHRFSELKDTYAPKHIEQNVVDNKQGIMALDKEIEDMPDKLSRRFAGVWVEAYTKAIIFTIGGSIIASVVIAFITKG